MKRSKGSDTTPRLRAPIALAVATALLSGCAAMKAGARDSERGDTAPAPPVREISFHLSRDDGATDGVALPYYCAEGACWVGRDAVLREEHIGRVTVQQGETQAFLTLSFNEKGKAALRLLARGGTETGPLVLDVDGRVLQGSDVQEALRTGAAKVGGPSAEIFDLFDQLRGHTHPDAPAPETPATKRAPGEVPTDAAPATDEAPR